MKVLVRISPAWRNADLPLVEERLARLDSDTEVVYGGTGVLGAAELDGDPDRLLVFWDGIDAAAVETVQEAQRRDIRFEVTRVSEWRES